eukprot:g3778.t1
MCDTPLLLACAGGGGGAGEGGGTPVLGVCGICSTNICVGQGVTACPGGCGFHSECAEAFGPGIYEACPLCYGRHKSGASEQSHQLQMRGTITKDATLSYPEVIRLTPGLRRESNSTALTLGGSAASGDAFPVELAERVATFHMYRASLAHWVAFKHSACAIAAYVAAFCSQANTTKRGIKLLYDEVVGQRLGYKGVLLCVLAEGFERVGVTGGFERVGMTEKIKGWLTGGETAAPETIEAGASLDGGGASACEASPTPTETAAPETIEAGASLDGGGASACEASPTPTDFGFLWNDAQGVTLSDGDLHEAMADLAGATPDWAVPREMVRVEETREKPKDAASAGAASANTVSDGARSSGGSTRRSCRVPRPRGHAAAREDAATSERRGAEDARRSKRRAQRAGGTKRGKATTVGPALREADAGFCVAAVVASSGSDSAAAAAFAAALWRGALADGVPQPALRGARKALGTHGLRLLARDHAAAAAHAATLRRAGYTAGELGGAGFGPAARRGRACPAEAAAARGCSAVLRQPAPSPLHHKARQPGGRRAKKARNALGALGSAWADAASGSLLLAADAAGLHLRHVAGQTPVAVHGVAAAGAPSGRSTVATAGGEAAGVLHGPASFCDAACERHATHHDAAPWPFLAWCRTFITADGYTWNAVAAVSIDGSRLPASSNRAIASAGLINGALTAMLPRPNKSAGRLFISMCSMLTATAWPAGAAQLEAADAYQTLGELSARVDFTTTFRSLGAPGAALPGCPALDFVDVESLLTADTLGKYNLGPSIVAEYSDAETVQYRDGGNGVVRALTVTNISLQNVIVLKVWGDTANDPIFAEPGAPQIPFEITATGVTINAYKGNRELTLGKSGTASYGKSRPDINPDLIATTEPLSTATAEKDAAIFDLHGKLTRFYVKVTPDGGTPPRSPGQIRMLAHHFVGNRSELEAKLAEKYKTNLAELSDDDGGGG